MFYLLKFIYHVDGMNLYPFIILNEEEYEAFREHGGEQKLFTHLYTKRAGNKIELYTTSCKFSAVEQLGEYITSELIEFLADEGLQDDVEMWINELEIKVWLLRFIKQCKYCALNSHLRKNFGEISIPLSPADKDLFFEFYSENKIPVPEICPEHGAIFYWSCTEAVDVREDLDDIHPEENIVTLHLRNKCLLTPLTEEMIHSMK